MSATNDAESSSKRVARPDQKKKDEKLAKIESKISALKKEQAALNQKRSARMSATSGVSKERKAARDALNVVKAKMTALRGEREALVNEQKAIMAEMTARREKEHKLKDQIGRFTSSEALDAEIRRLEDEQSTTSLSLKEEKDLVKKISALKMSRKDIQKVDEIRGGFSELVEKKKALSAKIGEKGGEMDAVRKEMNAKYEVIQGIEKKVQAAQGDLPDMNKRGDEISAAIVALFKQRDDVYAAHNAEWTLYKEFQEQEKKKYAAEWEKELEEKKELIAEKKKEFLEKQLKEKPWTAEMAQCDLLIAYLEDMVSDAVVDSAAHGDEAAKATSAATAELDGMVAFKKDDSVDESGFQLRSTTTGRGSKRGKRKNKKRTVMAHTIDTISSFKSLDLTAPASKTQIPKSIEELRAKKAAFDTLPVDPSKLAKWEDSPEYKQLTGRGDREDRDDYEDRRPRPPKLEMPTKKSGDGKKTKSSKAPATASDSLFPLLPGMKADVTAPPTWKTTTSTPAPAAVEASEETPASSGPPGF